MNINTPSLRHKITSLHDAHHHHSFQLSTSSTPHTCHHQTSPLFNSYITKCTLLIQKTITTYISTIPNVHLHRHVTMSLFEMWQEDIYPHTVKVEYFPAERDFDPPEVMNMTGPNSINGLAYQHMFWVCACLVFKGSRAEQHS